MTSLDDVFATEPRLAALEALVTAVVRRDGDVPWEDVHQLLRTFLGVRRDASIVVAHTALVQATAPALRDEATLASVGHRLRDLVVSVDADRLAGTR